MSFCSAAIDLVIGAESSAGSTLEVISERTETKLLKSVRTRSFLDGSPRRPRSKAELNDRCTEAQDRVAKGVMFWRPRNASTVLARLSIQVFRRVFDKSNAAVLGLIAGRQSSDVIYET